jgi:hypothetical protein
VTGKKGRGLIRGVVELVLAEVPDVTRERLTTALSADFDAADIGVELDYFFGPPPGAAG